MKILPPLLAASFALTVSIVGSAKVVAQVDASAQEFWSRTPHCIAAPVRDAPFSAEAVTTWSPTANRGTAIRSTAHYYRDSAGRVRVDFVDGMTPQRVFITLEADSHLAYALDTVARTAFKGTRGMLAMMIGSGGCGANNFILPLSMTRFVSFMAHPLDEEPLGKRSLSGVQTTGTRFIMLLPAGVRGMGSGESWVSPELQMVVYGRREDAEAGIVEHRLTKITRAEPPAALFEVPADYAEIAFPCMTWETPYSQKSHGSHCGH